MAKAGETCRRARVHDLSNTSAILLFEIVFCGTVCHQGQFQKRWKMMMEMWLLLFVFDFEAVEFRLSDVRVGRAQLQYIVSSALNNVVRQTDISF